MAARPVNQTLSVAMEVNNPRLELVHFTTQSTDGDYYDCKKLANVNGAWATNLTSDSKEIRVESEILPNGQARVRIYPEEPNTSGYLSIEGKK